MPSENLSDVATPLQSNSKRVRTAADSAATISAFPTQASFPEVPPLKGSMVQNHHRQLFGVALLRWRIQETNHLLTRTVPLQFPDVQSSAVLPLETV